MTLFDEHFGSVDPPVAPPPILANFESPPPIQSEALVLPEKLQASEITAEPLQVIPDAQTDMTLPSEIQPEVFVTPDVVLAEKLETEKVIPETLSQPADAVPDKLETEQTIPEQLIAPEVILPVEKEGDE